MFQYWRRCTSSDDSENAIHIWYDFNNLSHEERNVADRSEVCVDITALLTLAELDMLVVLSSKFSKIVISRGTKIALNKETSSRQLAADPLAEKIELWRLSNRSLIRVRSEGRSSEDLYEDEGYAKTPGGILFRQKTPIDIILGDGVGETLLLAQKLRVPLYSDESIVRKWAVEEYGVLAFSSLGLFRQLRSEGYLTTDQETVLLTKMIQRNFRLIPFGPENLNSQLEKIVLDARRKGEQITYEIMCSHETMGILLRQFGESGISEIAKILVARDWWLSVLTNSSYDNNVLVQCMIYPTFCISMITKSGVLTRILENEQESRAARLFAYFLWFTYVKHAKFTGDAWLAIKGCAGELFQKDERQFRRVLFSDTPTWLLNTVRDDPAFSREVKISYIVDITSYFPAEERFEFESVLSKRIDELA